MNKATINIHVQVFVWASSLRHNISTPLDKYQEAWLLGYVIVWLIFFLRQTAFQSGLYHFVFPSAMNESTCSFTSMTAFGIVSVFYFGHSNVCEGDQLWDFFGRNDAKAETPVLWPTHEKRWLIGKDSDAGRDWGQEEKGTTEDEMAGWHHGLNECESEWTLGDGDGQGGLVCCDSWGHKESDTTEWLNWTELNLLNLLKYVL